MKINEIISKMGGEAYKNRIESSVRTTVGIALSSICKDDVFCMLKIVAAMSK